MSKNIAWVSASFLILATVIASLGFWHTSQAAGTTITGCVNGAGLVYVIGSGFLFKKCNGKDKPISWDITGPQGPQGIQGPAGPKGDKGDKGDQGVQGIQGEQGVAGEQGPQGLQGEKGDKGDQGDQGPSGLISGSFVVENAVISPAPIFEGSVVVSSASCPLGSIMLGGGAKVKPQPNIGRIAMLESYPSDALTWTAVGTVVSGGGVGTPIIVTAYALCSE